MESYEAFIKNELDLNELTWKDVLDIPNEEIKLLTIRYCISTTWNKSEITKCVYIFVDSQKNSMEEYTKL